MSDMALHQDHMTLADYEAFVAPRPEDECWELIGGRIVMMTNPTANHGIIVGNIFAPLKLLLDGGSCRAFAGGMRVQRSTERSEGDATIPDVVVDCGPRRNLTYVTDASVIVEVLSRSTMDYDRGQKLAFHKSLPTVQNIVLVYQDQMRIEHYAREPDGWWLEVLNQSKQTLRLESIGFSINLETIYADIPVLRSVSPADAADVEPPVRIA